MKSNNKLKEINNKNCDCYYGNDIFKFEDFDLYNFSIDEKSYEYILACSSSYKTLIGAKALRIRLHKIDGFF